MRPSNQTLQWIVKQMRKIELPVEENLNKKLVRGTSKVNKLFLTV